MNPYREPGIPVGGARPFVYPCKCNLVNRLSTEPAFDLAPWSWQCCLCGKRGLLNLYFICVCGHQREMDAIEFAKTDKGKCIYRFTHGTGIMYRVWPDNNKTLVDPWAGIF